MTNLNKCWQEPNYIALKESGEPIELIKWKEQIYKNLPLMPQDPNDFTSCKLYEQFIVQLRNCVDSVRAFEDTFSMDSYLLKNGYIAKEGDETILTAKGVTVGLIDELDLLKVTNNKSTLIAEIKADHFLYSEVDEALEGYEFIDLEKNKLSFNEEKTALFGSTGVIAKNDLNPISEIPEHGFAVCLEGHLLQFCNNLVEAKNAIVRERKVAIDRTSEVIKSADGRYFLMLKESNALREDLRANRWLSNSQMRAQGKIPFRDLGFLNDYTLNNNIEEADMYCRIYNALHDLCKTLKIADSSASLNGELDYTAFKCDSPMYERVAEKWILEVVSNQQLCTEELKQTLANCPIFLELSSKLESKFVRFGDNLPFDDPDSLMKRGFAIYLAKKSKEIGIINPYLTGFQSGYVLPTKLTRELAECDEFIIGNTAESKKCMRCINRSYNRFFHDLKESHVLEERHENQPELIEDEPSVLIPSEILKHNKAIKKHCNIPIIENAAEMKM